MSHVDNVILSVSILEDSTEDDDGQDHYQIVDKVNAWLREHAAGQEFGPELGYVDSAYGGHKCLEAVMFVAAFNYWPEHDFMAFLETLPWEYPDQVQVLVRRQNDDLFKILQLTQETADDTT